MTDGDAGGTARPARDTDEDAARLYDLAPCGLLVLAGDGTILRVNSTLLARTGHAAGDLVGRPFASLLDRGAQIFYETRFLPVLRLEGEVREAALAVRLADGSTLPALVTATARAGAEPARIDVAVFDARDRQDFERLLVLARRNAEISERRTRILQSATSLFGEQDSEDGIALALADTAREALDASVAAVVVDDGEPRFSGASSRIDTVPLSDAVRTAAPDADTIALVSVRQDDIDPAVSAALRDARLEAFVRVPVVHDSVALGHLVCYFSRSPELDENKRELLLTLVRQAAQTLARIRLQARLAAIALHDPLTGLANRALLRSHVTTSVSAARKHGEPLTFIFVDLDDFKTINDELDHTAGDTVLKLIASRLTAAVRADDLVCRYGGDEFVIVCQNTDEDAAAAIAERIRTEVKQPFRIDGAERTVTASIGVTVHQDAAARVLDEHELLHTSDEAMYRSKVRGKDTVTLTTL